MLRIASNYFLKIPIDARNKTNSFENVMCLHHFVLLRDKKIRGSKSKVKRLMFS